MPRNIFFAVKLSAIDDGCGDHYDGGVHCHVFLGPSESRSCGDARESRAGM